MKKTIILTYHRILDSERDLLLYDVSLSHFREQMDSLRRRQSPEPKIDILLTFDDGFQCWAYEVLEILNEHGLKAHFFVCLKHLEKEEIAREDIAKLREAGMTLGSHSMTHRFLHTLSERDLEFEMNESKKILQEITGDEIDEFSLPYGVCTPKIVAAAQRAGYKKLFTSTVGVNVNHSFSLKRIAIKRNTSLTDFQELIQGNGMRSRVLGQILKETIKKTIGIRTFHTLRNKIIPMSEQRGEE
jgi:peptidoglycan/xylan/chitin deacetylase (PgdA/CDA1 family)